jgi:hypothetical protein
LICPCREFLPFLLPRFPEESLFFFDLAILFVCWFVFRMIRRVYAKSSSED